MTDERPQDLSLIHIQMCIRDRVDTVQAHKEARARTMARWQKRWTSDTKGRWTARLIKQLAVWTDRKHGEINYFLTQFLTAHGLFRAYLYRMGKVDRPDCIFCKQELDDVNHTFFICDRWKEERQSLENVVGQISPENIIEIMLESEHYWEKVATYIEKVRCV